MSAVSEPNRRFVASLEKLRDSGDRAALAQLRRGLGRPPGSTVEMYPFVVPWLGASTPRSREDALYTVASLFASHPAPGGRGNLGAAFGRLRAADPAGGDSVERRFVALLNCHADELPAHLRHAVSLFRAREVPLDWAQLLSDLQRWGHEDRFIQREWARAFWGRAGEGTQDSRDEPAGTAESERTGAQTC